MGVIARREEMEGGHRAIRLQVLLGSSWNPAVFQYSRKAAGQIKGSSHLLEGCLPAGSRSHSTSCLEPRLGGTTWSGRGHKPPRVVEGRQGTIYGSSTALCHTLSWCMPVILPRSGPHVTTDLQKLTWARLIVHRRHARKRTVSVFRSGDVTQGLLRACRLPDAFTSHDCHLLSPGAEGRMAVFP